MRCFLNPSFYTYVGAPDSGTNSPAPCSLTRSSPTYPRAFWYPLSSPEFPNLPYVGEHVHEQFVRKVLRVLQTLCLPNPAYYMSTYKATHWTASKSVAIDVRDPTGTFPMAASNEPYLVYRSHDLVLKSGNQELVAQDPQLHELQNLRVKLCFGFSARLVFLDAID
jgi:hypothetical protein